METMHGNNATRQHILTMQQDDPKMCGNEQTINNGEVQGIDGIREGIVGGDTDGDMEGIVNLDRKGDVDGVRDNFISRKREGVVHGDTDGEVSGYTNGI